MATGRLLLFVRTDRNEVGTSRPGVRITLFVHIVTFGLAGAAISVARYRLRAPDRDIEIK